NIPRWPSYLSMLVSFLILAIVFSDRLKGKPRWVSSLFVVNATFISFALCVIYSNYNGGLDVPFQATKLGAIVAGVLAPGFISGLLAIAIHVGTSLGLYLTFSPSIRMTIGIDEPWAMLAFGLGGCFILAHRFRMRQIEVEMIEHRTRIEATRRL